MKVTIISGSTRKNRISHRIALSLKAQLISKQEEVTIIDLAELALPPFYERWKELPDPEGKLAYTYKTLIEADGLIFLTPEYNGSISSSIKNFIDVFAKEPFEGKPIGVATGSIGALGGIRAAYQMQQIILAIFAYPLPSMLTVALMDKTLDENGGILDSGLKKRMDSFIDAFLSFVKKFK